MDRKEACEVLGLPQGCTDAEVTDAFRRLAKACHPDAGGTDYLFRKISEAKDTLKSKRPATASGNPGNQGTTPSKAKKTERKKTWREIVLDPNFYVPYEQFLIIVAGEAQRVRFGGYTVVIDEHDLRAEFIQTRIPVTVEVRTWENWFKRILGAFGKPAVVTKEMTFENKFPFSTDFDVGLTVGLHTKTQKYYKLTVKVLDQEFTKSGRSLTACQSHSAKKWTLISGLSISLKATFVDAD